MNQDNIIRKGKATQRKVKPHRFLFRELIIMPNSELFYSNLSKHTLQLSQQHEV